MFDVTVDDADLSENCRRRLAKYGFSLDDVWVKEVVDKIADYPEIIAAVTALPVRPEFDPELGGD